MCKIFEKTPNQQTGLTSFAFSFRQFALSVHSSTDEKNLNGALR